jgi:hypothetical protein
MHEEPFSETFMNSMPAYRIAMDAQRVKLPTSSFNFRLHLMMQLPIYVYD